MGKTFVIYKENSYIMNTKFLHDVKTQSNESYSL